MLKKTNKKKANKKKTKKFEFSKWIILGVMLTYFIGLFFGAFIISMLLRTDTTYVYAALGSFFAYIAAPVSVAIGFYNYKAKSENVAKINNNTNNNNIEPIISDTTIQNVNLEQENLNEQLKDMEEFRADNNDESLKG